MRPENGGDALNVNSRFDPDVFVNETRIFAGAESLNCSTTFAVGFAYATGTLSVWS